jgi:hypothetical protein
MDRLFSVVAVNTVISAIIYFGIASLEKFVLPQYISSLSFGNWASQASWSSWTPSVVIPVLVTAWRISPKLAVASLGGIVSMWGGFMITDFQQPPFMSMIKSALQGLQQVS